MSFDIIYNCNTSDCQKAYIKPYKLLYNCTFARTNVRRLWDKLHPFRLEIYQGKT